MAWHREWNRRNPELEPFVSGPRGLLGQTVQGGECPALERGDGQIVRQCFNGENDSCKILARA